MKNNKIKIIPILAVVISLIASFSLGYNIKTRERFGSEVDDKKETVEITASDEKYSGNKPKYVFLFIFFFFFFFFF